MNIGISNWHNSSLDSTKITFVTIFQFLARLLISTTLISLVDSSFVEMERCAKRAFQLLKMRKLKVSWNKRKCVTDFLFTGLRERRIILVITWWAHKRQTFTLISIKFMWILKFFFTRNRVFKHKGVVTNLHVCSNGLGKMWASYIFHFFTKNSNLQTYEKI